MARFRNYIDQVTNPGDVAQLGPAESLHKLGVAATARGSGQADQARAGEQGETQSQVPPAGSASTTSARAGAGQRAAKATANVVVPGEP
jgi:hypothetical protein